MSIELEMLLPHRKPMLLIGEIVGFDDEGAVTRSVATDQWPLATADGIGGLLLIELVAQTAGVNNGWELLKRDGPGGNKRGWIVAITRVHLMVGTIRPGTEIVVATRNGFAYENLREVHGTAHIDGQVAAEVTLQVMQAVQDR